MSLQDIYCRSVVLENGTVGWVRATAAEKMHCVMSKFGDVAWRDAVKDIAYVNGAKLLPVQVWGNFPLCFDDDGTLYVQFADDLSRIRRRNRAGDWLEDVACWCSPEGIKSVVNGHITVWSSETGLRLMPNGETWINTFETARYIVGGFGSDQVNPADKRWSGSISVYDKQTGETQRWLGNTGYPVYALEHDGQLYLDICGLENAPYPNAVPLVSEFPPYVPPVEPLPPIDLGPQRACWIDDMSGLGYGNASGAGFSQHVFEDARFVFPEHEPFVIALVHGPFEQSDLGKTIPMAQRLKKPVILSYDGHSQADLQPHRTALEAAGLTIWEGPSTYPSPPDETPEAMYDRLALTLMADSRPHALIAPGYRVHGRSDYDIARFNEETNRLKERFSQVQQVAVFGMDRPPIQQWCRDFWRAVTNRTPLPFIPPPVPEPEPPPIVIVVPPKPPDPPAHGWAKFLIILKRLFGKKRR